MLPLNGVSNQSTLKYIPYITETDKFMVLQFNQVWPSATIRLFAQEPFCKFSPIPILGGMVKYKFCHIATKNLNRIWDKLWMQFVSRLNSLIDQSIRTLTCYSPNSGEAHSEGGNYEQNI